MGIGAITVPPNSTSAPLLKAGSVPTRGVVRAAVAGRLEVGSRIILLANPDEEEAPAMVGGDPSHSRSQSNLRRGGSHPGSYDRLDDPRRRKRGRIHEGEGDGGGCEEGVRGDEERRRGVEFEEVGCGRRGGGWGR